MVNFNTSLQAQGVIKAGSSADRQPANHSTNQKVTRSFWQALKDLFRCLLPSRKTAHQREYRQLEGRTHHEHYSSRSSAYPGQFQRAGAGIFRDGYESSDGED